MKKKFFIILLFVFLLSVMGFSKKIELMFWTHEDPNRKEIELRYIEEFQKVYPDVEIKRVEYSSTKIQELILTAFAAKQGPDIFNMSIEDEYAYIVNGRVSPVDYKAAGYKNKDDLLNSYMEGMLDPVTFDDEVYGLPLEITNWCIFINKKVFRDAGLDPEKDYPKTWEDIVSLSQKIAIKDGEIVKRRGFDFRYPYYLVEMLPLVEQLGGKLISDDGKEVIVNDEAWLKFLDYMAEFGPSGLNLGSPTSTAARKVFNKDNNDIAMCSSGLYQIARIKAENPDFYNSKEWMVVPFPKFENAKKDVPAKYYGHYYMVNSQKPKKNQEMAWKFVSFMLSHPEEYLEKVAIIQPKKELLESFLFKSYPYSDVFLKDLEKAEVVFYQANSAKIQKHMEEAVQSVMFGTKTSKEALEILKRKVEESYKEGLDMIY
ncbi:MAG: multiple sugar transport system substrate-binding protein [Oceanotoga sp.]|uniref:extracellular solute-binding protein n=1 Tax=Oceanotoga sp. TaxID=2108366 RepID=UPI002653E01B|nr:extracellular solute-binding protein [Oceanotoga sp.]MDN5341947.1 multiple sugar transport system substrate-binding protein [Oceanotoga sp.]